MDTNTVSQKNGSDEVQHPFSSPEAFKLISDVWLRCGWDVKYAYTFSWLGRPIIQLPEDMFRVQEIVTVLKPNVIVETGIAHGGSLVFYASLLNAIGQGKIVGVDIEIRKHNREALVQHPLARFITLIEADSTLDSTLQKVKNEIKSDDKVLVILDSCHTKEHVAKELNCYAPLVSVGSYIVATDGVMKDFAGAPRSEPDWTWNNPQSAIFEFLESNSNFILEAPSFQFNEGHVSEPITYWPNAYLKRIK
ncbi:MAG: class I SAM-dependent methyltransferase [Candidatus Melainabacteria bacterium]|nr:class I SAM-dependent methyltransferase [Candidatus Melainabacteria bacterium]